MICPVCKLAMIVVEHQQIELDYCTNCKGVWFDSGELELLLESVKLESPNFAIKNILGLPRIEHSHKQLKCPVCRRTMEEKTMGQPAIDIDVCRQGDGLWFEGGELHELLMQLVNKSSTAVSSEREILAFLGNVFRVP